MLSHAEINERFLLLDRHPVLLEQVLDGWLAWPIVKERIWLLCFRSLSAQAESQSRLADAIGRLCLGISQIARGLFLPLEADLALLYEPRQIKIPDGTAVHPHLGNIGCLEKRQRVLHYCYDWGTISNRARSGNIFDNYGIGAVMAAVAPLISHSQSIRRPSKILSNAIAPLFPEIPEGVVEQSIANQLARFRIHTALMTKLFRRWKIKSVVALDASAKIAEVAAAKSLGLPVIEVQHGMFSAREPHYSWTATHRALAHELPLPDRMIVFGPLWSNQLREAGYWHGDEIIEVQNPVLKQYLPIVAQSPRRSDGSPLRFLFPTQGYVHQTAVGFLRDALEAQKLRHQNAFHMRIKVHPLEHEQRIEYLALEKAYPDSCSVAHKESEAFDEMLSIDCVVGYTSLMLIEAIGLGIPVIALRGGPVSEGFCATFGMPELADIIPDISNTEDFLSLASNWQIADRYETQKKMITSAITRIYSIDSLSIEDAISD